MSVGLLLAALGPLAGVAVHAPVRPLPPVQGHRHIKRGPRRAKICPRRKGRRRVQRRGSRTVHRAARKIRHGRQAAARYQQEDRDGTP